MVESRGVHPASGAAGQVRSLRGRLQSAVASGPHRGRALGARNTWPLFNSLNGVL